MINLIGTDLNYDWLKLPLVHLHWYDKEVRAGRKVGHLNLNDSDTARLSATLKALVPLLPDAGICERHSVGRGEAVVPRCSPHPCPLPQGEGIIRCDL